MHLADAFLLSKATYIQVIHFISMCVPWEWNPQPFALLTQCSNTETHTHTHTHVGFYGLRGLSIGNGLQTVCAIALHLNLALTGDGAFLFSLKKTHSVWFISVLNYGDTENVLINHLLLVIPVSYPCHYTNLCPHKPYKHAHTHTHSHTHTLFFAKPGC